MHLHAKRSWIAFSRNLMTVLKTRLKEPFFRTQLTIQMTTRSMKSSACKPPVHHHSASAAPQPQLTISTDRDQQRGPSENISLRWRSDSVSSEEIRYRDDHQRSGRGGIDELKFL